MAKLSLLLLGLVFLALTLQGGECLSQSEIEQFLARIRDSSTSTGHTQFAGVTLLDSTKGILFEDIQAYPDTSPIHTEAYLLHDPEFTLKVDQGQYLFIYTRNSPCVSSKASDTQGRTSCTVQISNFARQEGHLKVYVGFQIWYGKGSRSQSAAAKEQQFREEACENKPSNVEYIYMPKGGPSSVIIC